MKVTRIFEVPYDDPLIGRTASVTTTVHFDEPETKMVYPVFGGIEYTYRGQSISCTSSPAREMRLAHLQFIRERFSCAQQSSLA